MEDKIFKYLNSEMTSQEEADFRRQISEDAQLREQVENMSLLKATFSASDIEERIVRRKRRRNTTLWSGIAAAVFLLAGCTLYVDTLKYNGNMSDVCMLNAKFSDEPADGIVLRGSSNVSNALELYSGGNTSAALKILNDIIENPGLHNPSDAYFLKGVILIKENGFDPEAVKCLEKSENPQAKELLNSLRFKFLF